MKHGLAVLFSCCWLWACSASSPQPLAGGTPREPTASQPPPASGLVQASKTAPTCTPPANSPLRPELIALRKSGIAALEAGKPLKAGGLFAKVLAKVPQNHGALVLRQAARDSLSGSHIHANQLLQQQRVVRPALPPAKHTLQRRTSEQAAGPAPSLKRLSRSPNAVVDQDRWIARNALHWPARRGPDAVSGYLPTVFRSARVSQFITHPDHQIVIFKDRMLAVFDSHQNLLAAIDLTEFAGFNQPDLINPEKPRRPLARAQPLRWAQAREGVLYLLNANRHYARESNNRNGYLSAIDLRTGMLLWRSQPLVANSENFVIHGDYLISGYGFTAEPDFVYIVERATGKVVRRIPVSTSPDRFIAKGRKLFVRGYNIDWVFDLSPMPSRLPGPLASWRGPSFKREALGMPPAPSPLDSCLRAAAIDALDRGNWQSALEASIQTSENYRNSDVMKALLQRAQQLGEKSYLDLQRAPMKLAKPPFEYRFVQHPALPGKQAPPQLVAGATTRAGQGAPHAWLSRHGQGWPRADLGRPFEKPQLPKNVPPRFGNASLRVLLNHHDHQVLIYGDHNLLVTRDGRAIASFDLRSYLRPPKISGKILGSYIEQSASWAQLVANVLYVSNGGGSYASESLGKKGFITAIDATSGKLLWRSAPLVSNANFVVYGHYLISGYGFTDEPDFLYVLDRRTGKTVSRHRLDSGPQMIIAGGGKLFVRTFHKDHLFELR